MKPIERLLQERDAVRAAQTNEQALAEYLSEFDIKEQAYVISIAIREITRLQMEANKRGKAISKTA
ncbi:hypothetical protein D3C73_1608470 [compost metagenome]